MNLRKVHHWDSTWTVINEEQERKKNIGFHCTSQQIILLVAQDFRVSQPKYSNRNFSHGVEGQASKRGVQQYLFQ